MSESEREPLISPQRSPPKQRYTQVYVFIALLFLSSIGDVIAAEAVTDAQYVVICRYKGIALDQCFTEPIASDLEGILSSYLNVADSIWGVLAMLVAATCFNKFGIRSVCIGFLLVGTMGALGFSSLLNGPPVNYLSALIPAMLSNAGYFAVGSFFGYLYIAEAVADINMRTTFLGWVSAATSLVQIVGPPLGGYVVRTFGISTVFMVSAAFNCAAIVATYLFMTEVSKPNAEQQPSILRSIKLACGLCEPDHERKRAMQKACSFLLLASCAWGVIERLSKIYVKAKFGWSASENGYLKSVSSVISMLSVSVLSPAVLLRLSSVYARHPSEIDKVDKFMCFLYVSIISLSLFVLAVHPTPSMYFAATSFADFSSIGRPSLHSMILKFAPPDAIASFWLGISYLIIAASIPVVSIALRVYRYTLRAMPESYLWLCLAMFMSGYIFIYTFRAHTPSVV